MKTFRYGLVLVCFAVAVSILMGTASAETWVVDDDDSTADFTSIQAAVDEANAGDTIEVRSGTYLENVDVYKRLTLIGDGADVVTVRSKDILDRVFEVTADYVDISGFKVTGTGTTHETKEGFYLDGADHCNISNNDASENHYGIHLNSASDNTLSNNNASENHYGIHLKYSSNNNTLSKNTVSGNTADSSDNGIYLDSSNNNTLTENTASENKVGISLSNSSNNLLLNNTALSNNEYGIYLYMSSNNKLTNNNASSYNDYGIYLSDSNNNTLTENTASSNSGGIKLHGSSNNTLTNNTALSNGNGIYLEYSSNNNTLTNNTLSNNKWDLYVVGSESAFRDNTLGGTTISFTYEGDVSLKGVGSPAPDPAGWNTIDKFINATNQSVGAWVFLNFSYSGSDLSGLDELSLKVWKHNGTAWIEDGWNKTRYLDTEGNVIGVNITSFSVFAPVALAAAYIPPDPVGLANTTGRYWVNYTWSAGTGNVTDSYNVSMNEGWGNVTTETFRNVSVAPGGWANITVFAYNASGTGTLSLESISGNVQAAPPISHVNQTGWWRDGGAFNASGTPIQAAIDSATDGDTIYVWNGSYSENVDVNKRLTLRGEGADVVTLTAADADVDVFNVTADYVNISGFAVTGATDWHNAGIYLNGADYCSISDTNASKNNHGVYLNSSSYNTLVNNTFLDNYKGVYLHSSNNNTITDNIANSNDGWGILLSDSSNNTLTNNTISENDCNFDIGAWRFSDYVQNIDASNTVDGKPIYYWVNQQNQQIPNDAGYVGVVNSTNITVKDLTLINNGQGVLFVHTSDSRIENVNAANNTYGILLKSSNDNGLTDNTVVSNNFYGIYLSYSSNNTLSSNTLSDNIWDDLYIENSESAFRDNTLGGTTISFTYAGDVSLKGVGSPAPDPAGWNTIGKFINATNQSAGAWIFLNFSYSGSDLSGLDESSLKVWKHSGTAWIEDGWNKTRYLDTEDNIIGVNITSFSVFAPAALASAAYIPPDPVGLANTTGRYWVNHTWSAGTGNVTDSYNVSMNETWTNGTTETFRNVSIAPGGWANITVFAYNTSGTGTLSSGSISGNVQAPPPIIRVNQTGWWRDGGAFNVSGTPIQAAIGSATDGDTICVWNGSYSENVNVSKRLTLRGEGVDVVTLTAADADADVFNVTADYVNISGFTVTGAVTPNAIRAGFYLGGADHCNISNNDASENIVGIYLDSASDNILSSNNASGNDLDGIYLESSNNNMLTNNNVNSNVGGGGCGIRLGSSSNNMLTNNTALENQHGIELSSSSNNMLTNNNASGNGFDGIRLDSSSNNKLSSNTVLENNRYGITMFDSSNNTLTNNTLSDNTWDDLYIGSSESTFRENTLGGTTISFTYDGDVSLRGVDSPASDPAGWNTIGKFIRATSQSAGAWIFLNFSYSGSDLIGLDESSLMVWKHNGTAWIEDGWNKTRYLDTEENIIGVNITGFSVFAPAALAAAYIPPDPMGLANTTGRYWVNYTWSAGTGNVTDSYNVSMNETWTNGTTETFKDVRVALGGWANITVFAYNASGTGMLSLESISDNVRVPPPTGINCTCDNICVNQTGWWRDGGVLNVSGTPIQAAIDSATDDDIICVWNGNYSENVNVSKRLTLQGESADVVTLTAADADADVFNVTKDYVNISGFTVEGASGSAGIYFGSDADHCNLSGNTITNNSEGVHLAPDATGNIINFNNIAGNSLYGINNTNVTKTNATCNWWGDVSGPSGAGNGTGDAISVNVDYAPWLGSPYPEGKSIYFTNATTNTTGTGTTEIDAREVADTNITISTTAPVNVTIGNYSRNPGESLEGNITKYIDVHVNNTTNVDRIEIRVYYTDAEIQGLDESSLRMYWWNNSAWVNCSDSGVNITNVSNYSGYVWVNITNTTTPGIGDLNGSVLAPRARKGPPPPPEQRSRGRGTYPVLTPTPPTPTPPSTATDTPDLERPPTPELPPTPPSVPSTQTPPPTPPSSSALLTKPDIPLVIAMVAVVASAVYLLLRRRKK